MLYEHYLTKINYLKCRIGIADQIGCNLSVPWYLLDEIPTT